MQELLEEQEISPPAPVAGEQVPEVAELQEPASEIPEKTVTYEGFAIVVFLGLLRAIMSASSEAGASTPSMMKIAQDVCQRRDLTMAVLMGAQRARAIAHARFEAMYLMRVLTGKSLTQIARFLNKDHTTVLHGCERWAEMNGLPRPWKEGAM